MTMASRNIRFLRKGDSGDKGERGPTLRGPQDWESLSDGYAFEAGGDGDTYIDVVIYDGYFYTCKTNHTKTSTNYPGSAAAVNGQFWQLGDEMALVVAKVILATNATIEMSNSNELKIINVDGEVEAGMSGEGGHGQIRMYAGSSDKETAPFRVNAQGELVATKATITGTVSATMFKGKVNTIYDESAEIDGSVILGPGVFILPEIEEGEAIEITIIMPFYTVLTRVTIYCTIQCHSATDQIIIDETTYTQQYTFSVTSGEIYKLFGYNEIYNGASTNYWRIIEL